MASGFGRKEIFIVGNGKSLKDFNFNFLKDKKWIGVGLGFRHWVVPFQHFIMSNNNPFRYLVDYCTGTCASLYGYILGFEQINLLGMDCKYVEFIPECIEIEEGKLKIIETPKDNPNYYFNEYQHIILFIHFNH